MKSPIACPVLTCLLLIGFSGSVRAQKMARAEEPLEVGLTNIGDSPFRRPEGVAGFPIPNGGFEDPIEGSDLLKISRFARLEAPDAPEGKAHLQTDGGGPSSITLTAPAGEGEPLLFSAWMRTSATATGSATCESSEIYYGKTTPLNIPDTGGGWKRVGLYFRTAPGTTAVRVLLGFPAGAVVSMDDLEFRRASESEYSKAYSGWRSQYPERDLSPRLDDGRNLPLFLSKLTDPLIPNEPLRVIGIGSSYTNMLGNGERLIQWIRDQFPNAPPILYEKHVGSAVEFDFTKGWMRQHVLGKKPDLVILYSGGTAEDLDQLLADFRAHSSADVIVASLHLRERDGEISETTVNAPEWDAIRDVALKYGCEWVDSRREWAAYLLEHGKPIEWLLKDAVHQNDHGALVINENICRHLVVNPQPAYRPEDREEFIPFESHSLGGKFKFEGSRIDLIGSRSPDGGILGGGGSLIRIDGIPLDEWPAFVTTLILPGPRNHKPERGSAADRSPHLILLGDPEKILPQAWTIRMISDTGAYELIGSVTGHDGYGHNGNDFTGNSGQITVPSDLWRRRLEPDGVNYTNRAGDIFTWRVERATTGEISFRGEAGEVFSVTLADQLPNGGHELEIGPSEGGPCEIKGVRVHRPPFPVRP